MTQSLRINDKEYVPISELLKSTKYTSDYISKLARDEKILGTRVGRQWFIEPESLRVFLQQLDVEKSIASEELSRQRKAEHEEGLKKKENSKTRSEKTNSVIAAGQALAVVACGALVGVMGLTAHSESIALSELQKGAQVVLSDFWKPVEKGVTALNYFETPTDPKPVASPILSGRESRVTEPSAGPQFESGLYAELPQADSINATATEAVTATSLPFSDAVVVTSEEGELFVRPVLRDNDGLVYQLSAVNEIQE